MSGSIGTAAGLGAVTGLRSFTAAALVARELSSRDGLAGWRARRGTRLQRWLGQPTVARALEVLAAGEMLADKLPGVPDRVAPGPLAGRMIIGGLLGGLVVADRRGAGAAAGALGALAGTLAGWWLRREAGRATHLPDPALALAEDAVAVAAARELALQV